MGKTPYTVRVRTRINELQRQISELQGELHDLQVTERVLSRLSSDDGEDEPSNAASVVGRTVAEDIIAVLKSNGALERDQIQTLLDTGPRPGVPTTTVATTLSRMKAADRVYNEDGKWFIRDSAEITKSDVGNVIGVRALAIKELE